MAMKNNGVLSHRQQIVCKTLGIDLVDDIEKMYREVEQHILQIEDVDMRANLRSEFLGLCEVRSMEIAGNMQIRADSELMIIKGYPILFNVATILWGEWKEQIHPDALLGVDLSETRLLINHNVDLIMGKSGINVEYQIDNTGLYMKAKMPDTQMGKDYFNLIAQGILDGMSFMFRATTIETDWENKIDTIKKISVVPETSIVTFPAYPQTVVIEAKEVEVLKSQEEEKSKEDVKQIEEEREKNELDLKAQILNFLY